MRISTVSAVTLSLALLSGCAVHDRYNIHSDYCRTNMVECAQSSAAVQWELQKQRVGIHSTTVRANGRTHSVTAGPSGGRVTIRD